MHYEMTLHLCVATCVHAQMIDKLMNWYMYIYNTCLTDCLDKHTPWYNVQVRDTTPHPWYDTDIDVARNKKRKQENVWRRTKLEIHRQLYVTAWDECTALISAHAKRIVFEINWKRQATKTCFVFRDRSMVSAARTATT